ncbi:MAG: tRNA-guanine transglycosylase [Acutalibacteraceae bacterium]
MQTSRSPNAAEGVNPQLLFGINQARPTPTSVAIAEIAALIGRLRDRGLRWASSEEMYRIIEAVEPHMPKNKIRYLMGVGTPANILEGVYRGVDLFDCVMPSRNARHGHAFTNEGCRNLLNAKYTLDDQPIDPACDCPICRRHSRAYIHHLFKAGEMLAMRLTVMHNLYFYNNLMERIRSALDNGTFEDFYRTYAEVLGKRI